MSTWTWIFVVIIAVLVLATLMARRTNAGVDPTQLLLDPELVARVRVLAQQNQKVAAIKMLREGTPGLGLGSAKVMVDRMAPPRSGTAAAVPGTDVPPDVQDQARALRDADNKIGAIKLVRTYLPGLQDAKKYVEGL
jgi:ribosomal protein L7/L12